MKNSTNRNSWRSPKSNLSRYEIWRSDNAHNHVYNNWCYFIRAKKLQKRIPWDILIVLLMETITSLAPFDTLDWQYLVVVINGLINVWMCRSKASCSLSSFSHWGSLLRVSYVDFNCNILPLISQDCFHTNHWLVEMIGGMRNFLKFGGCDLSPLTAEVNDKLLINYMTQQFRVFTPLTHERLYIACLLAVAKKVLV